MTRLANKYRKFSAILAIAALCATIVSTGYHHHYHIVTGESASHGRFDCQAGQLLCHTDHGIIEDTIAIDDHSPRCAVCQFIKHFQPEAAASIELVPYKNAIGQSFADLRNSLSCSVELNSNLRAPPVDIS